MDDQDELTQRERRAQRHQQNRRKEMPGNMRRNVRAYGPMALILLAVVGAAAGIYAISNSNSDCVSGHWHATMGVFVPGEDGSPVRVDFAAPRVPGNPNLRYNDFAAASRGGNSAASVAVHMHLSGSESEGGSSRDAAQIHMEDAPKCVFVKEALHVLEVDADADSLTLFGGHTQIPGQSGTFEAEGNRTLRYWIQSLDTDTCGYVWEERSWSSVRGYQLQDGESLLVALVNGDVEASELQAQIPTPLSRDGAIAKCMRNLDADTTTTSATTSATTSEATSETATPTGNASVPA